MTNKTRTELVTEWKRLTRELGDQRLSETEAEQYRAMRDRVQSQIAALDSVGANGSAR